jgi:hypothetical protein
MLSWALPCALGVSYYGDSHGYINALDGKPLKQRGDAFEVKSPPLKLLYGQVHNTFLPTVEFPPEIVRRFANRTIVSP